MGRAGPRHQQRPRPRWSSPPYGAPQRIPAKTPAWYKPPRSPYSQNCIALNKHIKDGDIIFQHYKHFSKVLKLEFLSSAVCSKLNAGFLSKYWVVVIVGKFFRKIK